MLQNETKALFPYVRCAAMKRHNYNMITGNTIKSKINFSQ
jgi:hypothetical protein